jgi:3-oxoacyl-[acyl-carrier protein] reductase
MRLQGKVAIVTGAAQGIGRAIAEAYASNGARLVLADMNREGVEEAAASLRASGAQAVAVAADVSNEDAVAAVFKAAICEFGTLDVLVCNAGVGLHRPLIETSLEEWNRLLRVNLTGTFMCLQAAAREFLRGNTAGSIVLVGSTSGLKGAMARTAYGVSKAGVTQLARVAATELGPQGIRVNVVAPGPIDTPLSRRNHSQVQRSAYLSRIPLKRYGRTEEVAQAAVFLGSDDASYVSGHTLLVDGGMTEAGLMFEIDHETTKET